MVSVEFPATAAWQHQEARTGFEVVYFRPAGETLVLDGCTTAIENGQSWIVSYRITVDAQLRTRSAEVTSQTSDGIRTTLLEADGAGHWRVDGKPVSALDGCYDVDLESSALTNALPVHRLGLNVGDSTSAPAAYVRALDLSVERLDQNYLRVESEGDRQQYDYRAPVFDFACRLVYDALGLVLEYPGIATRAA